MTFAAIRPTAALLAAVFLSTWVRAAPPRDEFWTPPQGAIACWAFDPGATGPAAASDPTRALVEAGLRALLARVMPLDRAPAASPIFLLHPGLLGAAPYRLVLLDLAADDAPGNPTPDRPAPLSRFAAILEVRSPDHHDDLIAALRSALNGAPEQTATSADGRAVIVVPSPRGPTAEVSWCSTPTGFIAGFGHGAIDRWLAVEPLAPTSEPALALGQLAQRHAGSTPVLAVFVDLNALRANVPEQFAFGRIGRLLHAWGIANARILALTARLMPAEADRPRLLAIDAALSARSERPGLIHPVPLTESAWPPDLDAAPAPYAIIARSDWGTWLDRSLRTWAALSPAAGRAVHTACDQWLRRNHAPLDRLLDRIGPWTLARGGAVGLAIDIPIVPVPRRERVEQNLQSLFQNLAPNIAFDPARRLWSLTLDEHDADPDRLLRRFYWGASRDGVRIVGGWQEKAVARETDPAR